MSMNNHIVNRKRSTLSVDLIKQVVKMYPMNIRGAHGSSPWMRVRRNGLLLSQLNGADQEIVELFALFHDSQRVNENRDNGHGQRGAKLAYKLLKEGVYSLSLDKFDLLYMACRDHTEGGNSPENITVGTCWDADRLDLWRVGIAPDINRLCNRDCIDEVFIDECIDRARMK